MHTILSDLQREFAAELTGLDASGTQRRTKDDPTRWSIQLIVEHLLLTYELSASIFEERIVKGRPTRARPTLSQWVGQVLVLKLGQFPNGREAPERVRPGESGVQLSGEQLSQRTKELLKRFDTVAAKAEAMFGSGRSISHQVLGPLSVSGWRRFHLVHGRHHLKQIRAIRLVQEE